MKEPLKDVTGATAIGYGLPNACGQFQFQSLGLSRAINCHQSVRPNLVKQMPTSQDTEPQWSWRCGAMCKTNRG